MTGDCDIIVSNVDNVPRLPYNAVQIIGDGEATVLIEDPETKQPISKNIKIGVEGYEFVEIIEGLSEGDAVVLSF
jgi:HlyD family secretion protein